MKAVIAAFNQEKALVVGAFSVIVQPAVEPMEHYTALAVTLATVCAGDDTPAPWRPGRGWRRSAGRTARRNQRRTPDLS